jgi:hypothetical protein
MNMDMRRIALALVCFALSIFIYKSEVIDHHWRLASNNGGWHTPEDAIRANWDLKEWDVQILSNGRFRTRPKVNPYVGYCAPAALVLIGVSFVLLTPRKPGEQP